MAKSYNPIEGLKIQHPNLDFSKSVYTGNLVPIEFSCKMHDGITQSMLPKTMKKGSGCRECTKNSLRNMYATTRDSFISKVKVKYGDEVGCEKVVYVNSDTKVTLVCSIHGDFSIRPSALLNKDIGVPACIKCAKKAGALKVTLSQEEFDRRLHAIHINKYSPTSPNYINFDTPVEMKCNSCSKVWSVTPINILGNKSGCPSCQVSLQERELKDFVVGLGVKCIFNSRSIIPPLELDIVIPDIKIAIEYNGLYWHSEAVSTEYQVEYRRPENRHLYKTDECTKAGYRLIHIFEDEWIHKKEIVKSKLRSILKISDPMRIFARKTSVASVPTIESSLFFDKTHIQGSVKGASLTYGLYYNEELVACMSFCKSRFDGRGMELLRYSTIKSVVGGFSKLLKHFIRENTSEKRIVSYSDRRWSIGDTYILAGFVLESTSRPGYSYISRNSGRRNRVSFMKHKLPQLLEKFDPSLTEAANCANNGFYRIWDCGMDKWVLSL